MLILSRRESESIHLGDDIVLTIVRVSGEKVRIGITAPSHVKVLRNELGEEAPRDPSSPSLAIEANLKKPPITIRRAA
jgi:carbon storage regulator